MTEPRIEDIAEKRLIGMNRRMTLAENKTFELWSSFMPRRNEFISPSEDKFSIQVYAPGFNINEFKATTPFTKWGTMEALPDEKVPSGMSEFILPGGLYAVFIHKGPSTDFHRTLAYIYGQWIPKSEYELDERPQFEVLGDRYIGPNDPNNEEEVWVPIVQKNTTV